MWILFGLETSLWISRGPFKEMMALRVMKGGRESLSLFPHPPHLVALFLYTFFYTLWEGASGHIQLKCYLWESTGKKGRGTASFLKELMFDVALWCRHHGSIGRSNQENDYGMHKACRFCWSKTLWWGDICTSNSVSPKVVTVACQSAQLAQLRYEREDGFLLSPSLPPSTMAPSPHTLQNHVDLLNRCVKLIILWVLGNQWIVNCTLLKQHQSSDWSIILWGMNKR